MNSDQVGSILTKRKRQSAACDGCRKSKVRCDGGSPCGRCNGRNMLCTYTPQKKRGFARKRVVGDGVLKTNKPSSPVKLCDDLLAGDLQKQYLDVFFQSIEPILMIRVDRDTLQQPSSKAHLMQYNLVMALVARSLHQSALAAAFAKRAMQLASDLWCEFSVSASVAFLIGSIYYILEDEQTSNHLGAISSSIAQQIRDSLLRKPGSKTVVLEDSVGVDVVCSEEDKQILERVDEIQFLNSIKHNLNTDDEASNLLNGKKRFTFELLNRQRIVLSNEENKNQGEGSTETKANNNDANKHVLDCELMEVFILCAPAREYALRFCEQSASSNHTLIPEMSVEQGRQMIAHVEAAKTVGFARMERLKAILPFIEMALESFVIPIFYGIGEHEVARAKLLSFSDSVRNFCGANVVAIPFFCIYAALFVFEISIRLKEFGAANVCCSFLVRQSDTHPEVREKAFRNQKLLKEMWKESQKLEQDDSSTSSTTLQLDSPMLSTPSSSPAVPFESPMPTQPTAVHPAPVGAQNSSTLQSSGAEPWNIFSDLTSLQDSNIFNNIWGSIDPSIPFSVPMQPS